MTSYSEIKVFLFIMFLLISSPAVALSSLPEISFFGRVIDQYNQPVKNAKIWYSGSNAYLSAGGGRGIVETDEEGYFKIDTTGASLVLGSISHPDIDEILYELPNATTTNSSKAVSTITLGSKIYGSTMLSYIEHTEKDKAYVINAWRLENYNGAVSKNVRGHFDREGNVTTVNLTGKTYKTTKLSGIQDGQLIITCTTDRVDGPGIYGNWTVLVSVIDGGIQETNDTYLNKAPENGYLSSIKVEMKKTDNNYQYTLSDKRYYFRSNNEQEYGSLLINFEPYAKHWDDQPCIIDIKAKINPTSSRNLELKK